MYVYALCLMYVTLRNVFCRYAFNGKTGEPFSFKRIFFLYNTHTHEKVTQVTTVIRILEIKWWQLVNFIWCGFGQHTYSPVFNIRSE